MVEECLTYVGTEGAPTTLDGVTVSVNGTPAYISYVSPRQLNVEIPDTVSTGGPVGVVVSYQGQSSIAASLMINPLQPGLLKGTQFVVAIHGATGTLVNAADPAASGER